MLRQLFFSQYTSSELSATGWLRKQLEIQARGLGGNLDKIWPDVRDSKWVGGNKEGWERVPYWLDGFIPLAWLLNDEKMKARAKKYIDAILQGQKEDGWLCPCADDDRGQYDMWAFFLICKVLVVYHDCTSDERIEGAIYRGMKQLNRHIERHTLFKWAATRWYECLIPLFWLYERRPECWMEDLAFKLHAQGVDFEKVFTFWRFEQPYKRDRWSQMTHVVNIAMCLKSKALISRLTGEDPNAFAQKAIKILLKDHGMAVGHFTGDECLAGRSPLQGSELCSVVEAMYSYEWLLMLTGDSTWAERLENAAYNALPAAISPDMWTHQYDQMTNQIECSRFAEETRPFLTNCGESHLFGLEPEYGCCTANFSQGWPKFALSTFMRASDGIAVGAIAPSILHTTYNNASVVVENITEYPFRDGYSIRITTDRPVVFTLHLRIVSFAKSAAVDGKKIKIPADGWFQLRQNWQGEQTISIAFEFVPVLSSWNEGLHCVRRGPLLYALPIGERWERNQYIKNGVERKHPYCDYEIFPTSKWNYGFVGDKFRFEPYPIDDIPFNPDTPPTGLYADLAEVEWPYENGHCASLPTGHTALSAAHSKRLIPYGCTNLRMTEMPLIQMGAGIKNEKEESQ
ncbi:beta-L-arabinofuranosidase domain-containing protein [Marasmitruncus massiliensis]|uniref:beta-L-arabinofuranosidase domain-containing protein n=1 Tax=Marasmitruncus massiliensis TaxID=1944642 RepID=UPI0015E07DE0|nr:beta-L-arabinofuranosidase domain-containing protein [Marasmitruncus massiliensis]